MTSVVKTRARLLSTTVLAGVGLMLAAPAFGQAAESMETVTVTGYRASLTESTNAKRAAVNFSDSVFASDIGKFPDTNIAEAFNRIPGVTIQRENDGSGMRIAIRGLDTNHVKITLNGAVVSTASTGNTDSGGANREVDLNIFPIELFSQLTVSKTSTADMLEGGASGVVAMRSLRPFDNPGTHFSYNMQMSDAARNGNPGERGTLIGSYTDGPFGILIGLSGQNNRVMVTGYEGAFNSLTTPNLTAAQYYTPAQITAGSTCAATTLTSPGTTSTASANTCNSIGGNGDWNLPTTMPAAFAAAASTAAKTTIAAGQTIDRAMLLAMNPSLNIDQISNAIVPRTGRPMFENGTRKRYNGIMSFEYRPSDAVHVYLDTILGVVENNLNREDLFWIARNGASIPTNMKVDSNGVVTSGDMLNAQMSLEARPYKEKSDYISLNPGLDWQVNDLLDVKAQVNYSRAHFFRDSPTFLFSTPNGVVHYDNTGPVPTFTMDGLSGSKGLQDPTNYGWYNGSDLRLQQERRYQFTDGAHFDVAYGGDEFKVQAGFAFDDAYRLIRGYDNGNWFKEAGCNFNPTTFLPSPNSVASCSTTPATTVPAAWATNWGTGYSAGLGALPTAQGPLLPNSAIPNYLSAGPNGFVTVDYAGLKSVTKYDYFATHAPLGAAANLQDAGRTGFSTGTNTNISSGIIDEKTTGFYGEISGTLHRGDQKIKYNVGGRYIRTIQTLTGYTSVTDPRNANLSLGDGARYPNTIAATTMKGAYEAFLPSANLAWEMTEDFVLRGAVSRTMTRGNPASMLPQLSGGGSDAMTWTLGNPQLRPYYSTNIDFGAELYTGGEGYVGINIFKKMMTGFPSNYSSPQTFPWLAQFGYTLGVLTGSQLSSITGYAAANGCPTDASCVPITVVQARNATGLETIKGVELNWVQPLDHWLEPFGLKGLGWQANATFVSTKTTPNSAAPSVVLGVSPTQYNLTGYYDNDGVMLKVSYSYQRGTLTGSNVYGVIANMAFITQERSLDYGQVDLSSSMKLSKIFGDIPTDPDLTFDVQNLTHAKNGRSYKQYPNLVNYSYNAGSIFLIGVRGSL